MRFSDVSTNHIFVLNCIFGNPRGGQRGIRDVCLAPRGPPRSLRVSWGALLQLPRGLSEKLIRPLSWLGGSRIDKSMSGLSIFMNRANISNFMSRSERFLEAPEGVLGACSAAKEARKEVPGARSGAKAGPKECQK